MFGDKGIDFFSERVYIIISNICCVTQVAFVLFTGGIICRRKIYSVGRK